MRMCHIRAVKWVRILVLKLENSRILSNVTAHTFFVLIPCSKQHPVQSRIFVIQQCHLTTSSLTSNALSTLFLLPCDQVNTSCSSSLLRGHSVKEWPRSSGFLTSSFKQNMQLPCSLSSTALIMASRAGAHGVAQCS